MKKLIIGIITLAISGAVALDPQTVYAPTIETGVNETVIANVGKWLKYWVGIKIRLLFFS